jgi:hypothetical protein
MFIFFISRFRNRAPENEGTAKSIGPFHSVVLVVLTFIVRFQSRIGSFPFSRLFSCSDDLLLGPPQGGQRHPGLKKGAAALPTSPQATRNSREQQQQQQQQTQSLPGGPSSRRGLTSTAAGPASTGAAAAPGGWREQQQQNRKAGVVGGLNDRLSRAADGGKNLRSRQQQQDEDEWEPTGDPELDKEMWAKAKAEGKFAHLSEMPTSRDDFFGGSGGGSRRYENPENKAFSIF